METNEPHDLSDCSFVIGLIFTVLLFLLSLTGVLACSLLVGRPAHTFYTIWQFPTLGKVSKPTWEGGRLLGGT